MDFERALITLLKSALLVDNEIADLSLTRLNSIVERWSMGRYGGNVRELSDSVLIPEDSERKATAIRGSAEFLKKEIGPEGLGILLSDISELMAVRERLSHRQEVLLEFLHQEWDQHCVTFEEQVKPFMSEDVFWPTTILSAIGYLFSITLRVDGLLHKSEFHAFRDNLSAWDNESARVILSAVSLGQKLYDTMGFLDFFKKGTHFTDNEKQSVENCLVFLKKEKPASFRRLLYKQLTDIIKADGKIHPNELYIWERIRTTWDDLGVC